MSFVSGVAIRNCAGRQIVLNDNIYIIKTSDFGSDAVVTNVIK